MLQGPLGKGNVSAGHRLTGVRASPMMMRPDQRECPQRQQAYRAVCPAPSPASIQSTALSSSPTELGDPVMSVNVYLEPEAQEFAKATANPPYLFDLGPEKGRQVVDQVQSSPAAKPPVDVQEQTIPGGPSGQVSIRILRP